MGPCFLLPGWLRAGASETPGRRASFCTRCPHPHVRRRAAGEYAARIDVELLYRQQLSDTDRKLVESVSHADTTGALPGSGLLAVLESPAMEAAVFGPEESGTAAYVSPFLAFAVAVHRTAVALEDATFVEEHMGARRRIPVFDVAVLRALLDDALRRYFFVELLASYTRVSSGVTWRRTALGWRRQRFSELDPVHLASLLDVVGPSERPGVYRRLGDLSLFLLGVFPDHPPLPVGSAAGRLARQGGLQAEEAEDLDAVTLFERLGTTWYRTAIRLAAVAGVPVTGTFAVLGEVADHFHEARRVLNAVTDRYLFPMRSRWFPA
ncbi:MAG: hypothetical protein M0010_02080 [Actinomycetota bacterium]|nr:hypothetical protein [Actinomycetota bacterium]